MKNGKKFKVNKIFLIKTFTIILFYTYQTINQLLYFFNN